MRRGQPPMQPPPPGTGPFPGQPHSETFGPGHPVFNPTSANDPQHRGGPNTHLPPGSVPPGASFDPIGPPGADRFGPDNDQARPPPQ